MIGSTRAVRVFAYAEPVDMRKGYEGLGALVRHSLGRDLLRGDLFLFVGRGRRRAKVLLFDGTGLCIFMKRLEKGRFAAPWERSRGAREVEMTTSELALLLEGADLVGRRPLSPTAIVPEDLARWIAT